MFENLKVDRAGRMGEPKCFWRTGIATYSMTRMEASGPMAEVDCTVPAYVPHRGTTRTVYTDGSAEHAGSTTYAGWGVYDPEGHVTCHGALKGWEQTAAKAEVRALVAAAEAVQDQLVVYSDNKYVVDTANAIIKGESPEIDTHHDLWVRFKSRAHLVLRVVWIKSHMKPEDARRRGFTEQQRLGNEAADGLAKQGNEGHGYTRAQKAKAKRALGLVKRVQNHLASTYIKYINHSAVEVDSKLHRKPKLASVRTTRRGRPPQDPATRGHVVEEKGDAQFCRRCGRITRCKEKHTFWINKKCQPLPMVEDYKAKGHSLDFGVKYWACTRCEIEGKTLARGRCIPGGKRRGGPQGAPERGPNPPKRARTGGFLSSSLG